MSDGYEGPPADERLGMLAVAVYLGAFAYGMAQLACWVENWRNQKTEPKGRIVE